MSDLKLCPFCPNDAGFLTRNYEPDETFQIFCEECGSSTGLHETVEDAYDAWNTRPAREVDVEVLKKELPETSNSFDAGNHEIPIELEAYTAGYNDCLDYLKTNGYKIVRNA